MGAVVTGACFTPRVIYSSTREEANGASSADSDVERLYLDGPVGKASDPFVTFFIRSEKAEASSLENWSEVAITAEILYCEVGYRGSDLSLLEFNDEVLEAVWTVLSLSAIEVVLSLSLSGSCTEVAEGIPEVLSLSDSSAEMLVVLGKILSLSAIEVVLSLSLSGSCAEVAEGVVEVSVLSRVGTEVTPAITAVLSLSLFGSGTRVLERAEEVLSFSGTETAESLSGS